jgi:prephenate dehydratase
MQNLDTKDWVDSLPDGTTMSILGPPKTFTDKAARLLLGDTDRVKIDYKDSMWDIHDAVNNGRNLGLLAYTNYSSGHEPDNLEELFSEPWEIQAEVLLRVQMVLGGPGAIDLSSITDVYSKDVGLRQCSAFIRKYFPRANRHAMNSTVDAIREVAARKDPRAVAIGPKAAHLAHGNTILAEGVSNAEQRGADNVTHFMVVSRANANRVLTPGRKHHGIILTPKDMNGVTSIATKIMADNGMGLYSQPEKPIGPMKYEFLYLMNSDPEKSDVTRMMTDLNRHLSPANGTPLVQPISSWDVREFDEGLAHI